MAKPDVVHSRISSESLNVVNNENDSEHGIFFSTQFLFHLANKFSRY